MRFSIVTVTLNAERFLEETLASVVRQGFKDYEHIVWDGGSTDATLDIVKRFPHVKLFCGKDIGIADAMNRGAQFTRGEYLIHLHADDALADDGVLEAVDGFLTAQEDPAWAYGIADVVDEDGNKLRSTDLLPFEPRRLRKYNIITHPATFLSREMFLEQQGFRTDLKYCMDYELWLRLARSCGGIPMPIVVSRFREHHGSLSTREQAGVADEAYRVRNEYVRNLWERFQSYRAWKSRRRKIGGSVMTKRTSAHDALSVS